LGRGGREFTLYKFRTMHVGADRERAGLAHLSFLPPPAFKILRDPRVTKVGAFLRTWSLDEIPNLFNVLRGDMSLVGPRPNSWGLQTYEDWQLPRLSIRPGVTGPGQVAGRGNLSFDEHVRLDLQYVRTRSLGLDLKILGRTVVSVLSRRGAY
jgi:lipopolysaccharide/colanic/teichoic acid biosynthesis glycosyltransferase